MSLNRRALDRHLRVRKRRLLLSPTRKNPGRGVLSTRGSGITASALGVKNGTVNRGLPAFLLGLRGQTVGALPLQGVTLE